MSRVKPAYSRTRVITEIPEDNRTRAVQSEKKHADINHIVAKAYQTGQLPVLLNRQPMAQLPEPQTYQDMLNKVVFAQQSFERLPAEIRVKFDNNPAKMLAAVQDSTSDPVLKKQLQSLGVLEPEPIPAPSPVDAPTTQAEGEGASGSAGK